MSLVGKIKLSFTRRLRLLSRSDSSSRDGTSHIRLFEIFREVIGPPLPAERIGVWCWWIVMLIMEPSVLYVPVIKHDKKSLHFDLPLLIVPFVISYITSYSVCIFYLEKRTPQQFFLTFIRTSVLMTSFVGLNVYLVLIYSLRPGTLITSSALPTLLTGGLVAIYLMKVLISYVRVLGKHACLKIWINFLLFLYGGHVFGGLWYFFAVIDKMKCWNKACKSLRDCHFKNQGFLVNSGDYRFLDNICSDTSDNTFFNFGIFKDAIENRIVDSQNRRKILYCFRWGIQNISGFGQNLEVSTHGMENIFVVLIAIYGILTFTFFIGSMQNLLNSQSVPTSQNLLNSQSKQIDRWSRKGLETLFLFKKLAEEDQNMIVKRFRQCNWPQPRPVNFQNLLTNLPKSVEIDIKRILCSKLLEKVKVFEGWSMEWITQVYDCCKPVIYEKQETIIESGKPIDEMLLVMEGKLEIKSYENNSTNSRVEEECLCGEEIVAWFENDPESTQLPISSITITVLEEVHAFAILSQDLQNLIQQYKASATGHLNEIDQISENMNK